MVDTRFTPGPWMWSCGVLETMDGTWIADDGSAGGEYNPVIDTSGANAHLIASATTLYTALEALLASLDGDSIGASSEAVQQAEAALRRARGERAATPRTEPEDALDEMERRARLLAPADTTRAGGDRHELAAARSERERER